MSRNPAPLVRTRAVNLVVRSAPFGWRSANRARRARFVVGARAAARIAGAHLDIEVAPDVVVGRGVRVTFAPGSRNVLRVGAGSRLEDRILLMLKGGTFEVGERVDLRRDLVLNVAGRLRIQGDNVISWGCVIHCSNDIVVEPMVIVGEHTTITDSGHFFTQPDEHVWHNVRTGTARVGRNTWVCANATIGRGADVGSHCIVGSGSVITGVVPDGHLASGVPAQLRPLALPWKA